MSRTDFNVVFLPGLGADGRLFAPQREVFPDLVTPPWLPPLPHEELAHYAVRLAHEHSLGRPLILGGCSFGGMVAYEMARILEPDTLVLIGSVAARSEIPAYLRVLAGLSRAIPLAGFSLVQCAAAAVAGVFGVAETEHRRLFVEMLQNSSPEFLRWACIAVHGWRPRPLTDVPIFSIHGDNDHILPFGHRPVEVTVRGGGHLLPLTHPLEVNAALRVIMARCGGH
jgi:pimeloyl-ACP methyl ester carboxylesterase